MDCVAGVDGEGLRWLDVSAVLTLFIVRSIQREACH
jgi:hypothetical protein